MLLYTTSLPSRWGELNNGFLLKAHHIICDGWSMDLLTRQILGHYESLGREDISDSAVSEPSYLTYLDLEKSIPELSALSEQQTILGEQI
ncbi:condensation domain-containing protein [Paenibacillus rhizoplanae]